MTPPGRIAGAGLLGLLLALLLLSLSVPRGFPERWAGEDRLPDQAVRVSALYREIYGLPDAALPVLSFRVLHALVFAALWAPYALAVAGLRGGVRAGGRFWAYTGALWAVALLTPPLLSTDLFYYGATGELAWTGAANPHIAPPSTAPGSPLLPYVYWSDFPSPYGPLWTAASALAVGLVGAAPFAVSLAFKVLAAGCALAMAALAAALARRWAPGEETRAAALWAWNPLVLLECAGNGHNDAAVALLMVGALGLLASGEAGGARSRADAGMAEDGRPPRDEHAARAEPVGTHPRLRHRGEHTVRGEHEIRPYAAWALGVLAALVKLTVLPALGLLWLGRLARAPRPRGRRGIALLGVAGTLAALLYAPWWAGPRTLAPLAGQGTELVQGAVATPATYLGEVLGGSEAAGLRLGRLASGAALALVGLWLGWLALDLLRAGERLEPRGEGLLWGAALVLVPVAFVRSYPWYVVPGLALLACVWPHGRRAVLGLYALAGLWFVLQYAW